MNPLQQLQKLILEVDKMKESQVVLIKTILQIMGLDNQVKQFHTLYNKNYASTIGIDITTNLSTGTPTLTKYSRTEKLQRYQLIIENQGEKNNETDSTSQEL